MAGRKIFVGSLPDNCEENTIREEFGKYGTIEEVFVKAGAEPGRQWAFITYENASDALSAKESTDRVLKLAGAERAVEVMLAKNQGKAGNDTNMAAVSLPPELAPKKIFVGSLPDNCDESLIRQEFCQYGTIEEVFVKEGADLGRQWAFVTFSTSQEALGAKEATDRTLKFPGSDRAVEVMLAKHQGKGGTDPIVARPVEAAPKKIFIGSLPDNISENMLREEFSKYGKIHDIFIKNGCESGKHWAFVSYLSSEEAELAKMSTDRVLSFPGSARPVEVMLARNQGLNGQDPLVPKAATLPVMAAYAAGGPTKLHVGSLPDSINETILRAAFSKYGQILDVFVKTGQESGKQWAFMNFATHAQAQHAKDATDRILVVQGAQTPCETMFAKNQGKNGQDPLSSVQGGVSMAMPAMGGFSAQPPPPTTPMPAHYSGWTAYFTQAGLPYYYNHATGVTQWECPWELQYGAVAAQNQAAMAQAQAQAAQVAQAQAAQAQQAAMYGAMYAAAAQPRYGPY